MKGRYELNIGVEKHKSSIGRILMTTMTKLAIALIAPLLASLPSQAQDFPNHNITMIVPFPAGGPSDTVARIIAEGMTRHLGHNVVIENVGGAGGTLGATRASEATPDGYTIMAASMGTVIAAPSFYPNLKYDSTKDFEPIGMTANAPAATRPARRSRSERRDSPPSAHQMQPTAASTAPAPPAARPAPPT